MSESSDVSEVELSDEGGSRAGDVLRASRAPRASDHTTGSFDSEDQYSPQLKGISASAAANSWQDVDREQLSRSVLHLISSVAQTAPTDDRSRDAVWHPTTTITVSQNLNDPLGFGVIDVNNMRLVDPDDDSQSQQQLSKGNKAATGATAAGQGRGAVGRCLSELTKGTTAAAAAKTPKRPSNLNPNSGSSKRVISSIDPADVSHGGLTAAAAAGIPTNSLLPSEEGFNPEAYLAVFHAGSTAEDLAQGLRALERELGESTGQLKQLVKQNFERFISCKTTIDDIYVKLQRIESTSTGISAEVLYQAIKEVQSGASRVFGPILDRSSKSERIRNVQLLLRRFQGLFSAPDRIRALAAARDFEQVTAEFRKANALIKPGPRTVKVWISLYGEIEKRVTSVYHQLESEVQDPHLPATTASDLVRHMLQLQAEGLTAAQDKDPLELLLAARETQFVETMQSVSSEHERAVQQLKSDMAAAAAAAADDKLQDPAAAITEEQLLKWTGNWDSSSSFIGQQGRYGSSFASGNSSVAAAVLSTSSSSSSRHLSELAPLSGLQPPPPRSRLLLNTQCSAGEMLYIRYLQRQSEVVLECLPGLWQAAGAGAAGAAAAAGIAAGGNSKLVLPANLTAAAAAKLQSTINGSVKILERLVNTYSQSALQVINALSAVGPLREALLLAAEELATTAHELESQKAPAAAVAAVHSVLGSCIAAGVSQLVVHLQAVPSWLVSREGWQLSVTHSGAQPMTQLPEQLQEEITVVMQYYQQLLACSTGGSSSSSSSSSTAIISSSAVHRIISADKSTKPIRDAYFACLEDTINCCRAAADHLRPSGSTAASSSKPAAFDPVLVDADDEGSDQTAAAAAAGAGSLGASSSAAAGVVLRPDHLSDGIRLLLISSNVGHLRSRLIGSLTQRFLLVLTGEVAAELDRCSRHVAKLAARMDAATLHLHGVYVAVKRRSIDRLISRYIRSTTGTSTSSSSAAPVGVPADLRDVSPHAQQLVQMVTSVLSETYTYARPYQEQLLHAVLEHMGSALAAAFSKLATAAAAAPTAKAATPNTTAAAGGVCSVQSLGQYFMDLVYLEAALSKAGPPSLAVDVSAAQQLLATFICSSSSSSRERSSSAETPLARSLLAIKDPQELNKKLQVTCRKALHGVLERSAFTLRSLLAPTTAVAAAGGGGSSSQGTI